ncbi:TonB-dependent receptor [Riemerella columbina]|uniref:TonB-dependent receptor n=1 Tax=Riemerella columbina TaxID=103810 RepID=UPI00036A1181|nr:TonB-dependent receptor [Riemerella columbina]
MKKQIFSVLLLSLSLSFVSAQETENSIDQVVLQGKFLNLPYKKVNENIEVITQKEIQQSPAQSLDDLLQQISGMDIRRRGVNGVQSDVSIRGGSFDQVLVLVNGVRMNDSQTGHNNMNFPVDLSAIDRIEVIKGPAASRFGQNAYAGVINIVTKAQLGKSVTIKAEGGDFSTYELGLVAQASNEKQSHLFQANSFSTEGYRYNTDAKINKVFYQNQFNIKDGKIQFQAGFSEKKFGANGFYASPKFKDQYEETQASIVSLGYQQKHGALNLNANAYWRRGQDEYILIKQKPQIYRNHHIGNNIGGEFNASYASSLGTTGLGVELRKEFFVSYNNNPKISMGDRERFVTQLFFEHHFSLLNNQLQISPGISWANYGKEGNFFYPGINLGYDINNQHKVYAGVAKVHRIPTFTDLYYISGTDEGNPNLKPESAISSEVGYRFMGKAIGFKLSGFMKQSNDAIDWVKKDMNDKWQVRNIGEINTKGIEVSLNQKVTPWLKYDLDYTYLENEYQNPEQLLSKYALENLKHQFVGKLNIDFTKNLTNEWAYRYSERVNLGSYNLLDTKLTYHRNDYKLYLLINNLTNTEYTETNLVPMPKRWFHIGMSYTIK